jgi:membrane-associated phospholipid phosphatase
MMKRRSRICRETSQIFRVMVFIIIGFYISPGSIKAESNQNGGQSLDGVIKCIYKDTQHVLTSPLHWQQEDMIRFGILSVGTIGFMLMDKDLQKAAQRNRTSCTDRISNWTSRYTYRSANLTIGGFYLCGLVFNNRKCKMTALLCLESLMLSEGITVSLKHIVGRTRPFADKGAFHFDPMKFPPPSYSQSFPSGHATVAFAVSSVIAEQYESWMVKSLAYGSATLIAWGRVNKNVHFVSDVFWGGVIGISVGRCLVKFHRKDDSISNYEVISTGDVHGFKLGMLVWLK